MPTPCERLLARVEDVRAAWQAAAADALRAAGVDATLRLMARVAVTGHRRREHEARGRWPQALDHAVGEHGDAARRG